MSFSIAFELTCRLQKCVGVLEWILSAFVEKEKIVKEQWLD
jgi:hypothetical protein